MSQFSGIGICVNSRLRCWYSVVRHRHGDTVSSFQLLGQACQELLWVFFCPLGVQVFFSPSEPDREKILENHQSSLIFAVMHIDD